eukprot:4119269-Amphidinium_carterae.1
MAHVRPHHVLRVCLNFEDHQTVCALLVALWLRITATTRTQQKETSKRAAINKFKPKNIAGCHRPILPSQTICGFLGVFRFRTLGCFSGSKWFL